MFTPCTPISKSVSLKQEISHKRGGIKHCRGPNLSFEDFRNMAHSKLDQSLDKIKPLFFREEVPTLQEISDVVQEMKQDISGHLLQETTNSLNQTKLAHAFGHCPSCKKPVKKMRDTSRRIETRHGSSLISKPYFYCSSCRLGFSPVDEALELSSRKKQHDLQQLALKFLARLCFNKRVKLPGQQLFFWTSLVAYKTILF